MRFRVISNQNITPLCQDKALYHLVLQPENGQRIDYQPGDWLTLQAANQPEWVAALLAELSLSGEEFIELRRVGRVSVKQALTNHLEISQLNPAILNKMQRQYGLGDWVDRHAMMDYAKGRDILDLLQTFTSLNVLGVEFLSLLSPLAPRYYSIASAPVAVGNTVDLVVKLVTYLPEAGNRLARRRHYGVASYSVSQLQADEMVEGDIKPNPTFKLPLDSTLPIIMIGAGTGIAPYIGFIQQRVADKASGQSTLFFGETHQASSFLFDDYLQHCQKAGQLNLFTAFSRDQAEKYYVQDVIQQQAENLWKQLQQGAIIYICGDQFSLAKSVENTWIKLIMRFDKVDLESAQSTWQNWRKQKRVQLDVY
ncbi:MAG: NADP oxidoreductase [Thiomicrorhabdus sp.]|jgi:sulfite reductase (NADPH) flavoprotein alpha-component|nr:NADP oxidoreductase [Thiomicrorhabdus sp.]